MSACLLALALALPAQPPAGFPAHWWAAVPREGAPDWEILP